MAIAFVNGALPQSTAGATSLALPALNATAGNCILVGVGWSASGGVTSITDTAGNTYTNLSLSSGNVAWFQEGIWGAFNINGNASNVITVNLNGSQSAAATAVQYSGVEKTKAAALDQTAQGHTTAGTTATSGSFTPAAAGEVAVAFGFSANAQTYSAGTNYTLRETNVDNSGAEDRLNAPTSAQTAAITIGASDNFDIMVVTLRQPLIAASVLLPTSFARQAWNPDRTQAFRPVGPASQVVIVPKSPIPPVLPEAFARPNWNPQRTHTSVVNGAGIGYLLPESVAPIPPVLPPNFARPLWNPERTHETYGAPASIVVVVPKSPIPPTLPEGWWRPQWNPEKTDLKEQPYPASITVIVPRDPIPPVLPARWDRPLWNPERTSAVFPTGDAVKPRIVVNISAPATVEIDERFQVVVTTSSQRINETGGVLIPVVVADVVPSSSPGTMAFGSVTTKDLPGYGMMVIGTQPSIIQGSSTFSFYYEAVAFVPGTYTLSAAVIGRNGQYYITDPVATVVVTGP